MSNNCPICLEPLNTQPIGATNPCGHVFHRVCYDSWAATRAAQADRINLNRRNRYNANSFIVKCPTCNQDATDFLDIFLDLKNLQNSSETSDSDSDSDSNSDGEEDCRSGNNKSSTVEESSYVDETGDTTPTTGQTSQEVFVLSGNDDEVMILENLCTSTSSKSTNISRRRSHGTQNDGVHKSSNGNAKNDTADTQKHPKLKKKYKRLKAKLHAMKESVSSYQQVRQLYENAKVAVAEQAEQLENINTKYERELYEHNRDRRVLNDIKGELELHTATVAELRSNIQRCHEVYERRLRDLRDERDKVKATNMEEVQSIMKRDKEMQKLYDDLKSLCKQKERANRDLEKDNARLRRSLERDSRKSSESSTDLLLSSSATLTSRSKSIQMFQAANVEVEAQEKRRSEGESATRRKEEQKAMLRKSSSQAAKASRISQQLMKRRTSKPSFIGATPTAPRSRNSKQLMLDARPRLSSSRLSKKVKRK